MQICYNSRASCGLHNQQRRVVREKIHEEFDGGRRRLCACGRPGPRPGAECGKPRKAGRIQDHRHARDDPDRPDRREGRGDQEERSPGSSCRRASRSASTPSCPTPATWPSGPQGVVTFVGTRKTKVWAVTDRDKDRVADEVKEFAPSLQVRDPERRLLLARTASSTSPSRTACWCSRRPSSSTRARTSSPCTVVPQGELIPADGGELQPHRPRLPHRTGRQALHHARPARTTCRPPTSSTSTRRPASAASSAWTGRQGAARSSPRGIRNSVGMDFNPNDRRALVHRQPGRRHGRRHPAGRAQPRDRSRPGLRLSLVRRRRDPHQRIQGRAAARGRRLPAGRDDGARRRSRHDLLHRHDVPRRSIAAASSRPSTARGTAPSRSARG